MAGGTATRRDLAKLEAALGRFQEAMEADAGFREIVTADLAFHEAICEASGNPILLGIWRSITGLITAVMLNAGPQPLRPLQTVESHRELLDAIEKGDDSTTLAAFSEHFDIGAEAPSRHDASAARPAMSSATEAHTDGAAGRETATRVAIVTGAASRRGIGRATAMTLAERGFHVAALDLEADAVKDAAEALDTAGDGRVLPVVCDVTDRDQVSRAVDLVQAEFGRVDALVNNAGITAPTRIEDIEEPEWARLFAVNVKGVFLTTQAVLPVMRANGYGRIVSVSSVSAERGGGIFGGAHYSATKAAVMGLAKAVAREMGPHGITSNVVAPGLIDADVAAARLPPTPTARDR